MSLQVRLAALVAAIRGDFDALDSRVTALEGAGGGGGAVEWEPVTGGELTISNHATVDFTGLAAGYDYRLVLRDIVPINDQDALEARITTDGGLTWKDGGTDYNYTNLTRSNTTSAENSANADAMRFTHQTYGEMGNHTDERLYGEIIVFDPLNAAAPTYVKAEMNFIEGRGGNAAVAEATGVYKAIEAINGIQLFGENAGLASGKIKLYRRALPA